LREGIRPAQIALYFGDMGWLTVTEKTFTQYIQAFRRIYPEMLGSNEDEQHLDHYVDPRNPHLDEEAQLEQLIRMQKIRLGIAMKFEKDTGFINKDLHKDINSTTTMVETLAKMRGKMIGVGRPSHEAMHPLSNEAKEQMRQTDAGEVQQSKLSNLFEKLGSLMEQREAKQNAS
jgi:hypothetical protein